MYSLMFIVFYLHINQNISFYDLNYLQIIYIHSYERME